MKTRLRLLLATSATALALFGVTTWAAPAQATPANALTYISCHPSLSGTAFPYTATTAFPPPSCDGAFAWGFTVSGNATGQAVWDSPFVGTWTCAAQAWVPDSVSNDVNAQYYIFDGSRYLGNDAFIDQSNITNNWSRLFNNTWFTIHNHMRITLSDHNPMGQGNQYIAAYAIQFLCY